MENKVLDTQYVHLELTEGIIIVTFKSNSVIIKEIAEDIVNSRLSFVEGKSYPILADIRKMKSMDKAGRACFASPKAQEGLKAGALLSDSIFTTFLGNFFLRIEYFNKSPIPTRLFTNKNDAIVWLNQYR